MSWVELTFLDGILLHEELAERVGIRISRLEKFRKTNQQRGRTLALKSIPLI